MEFTSEEKRMIVAGLEIAFDGLPDRINGLATAADMGCKFEGKIAEATIDVVKKFETFLSIEKKILSSVDDDDEAQNALQGILENFEQLSKCKKIIGIFEDDDYSSDGNKQKDKEDVVSSMQEAGND